jgi:hypothetical protein
LLEEVEVGERGLEVVDAPDRADEDHGIDHLGQTFYTPRRYYPAAMQQKYRNSRVSSQTLPAHTSVVNLMSSGLLQPYPPGASAFFQTHDFAVE